MNSEVVQCVFVQFSQNPRLRTILLGTVGTVLAEASPYDTKWGIGLTHDDPRAKRRKMWRGTNFLGEVLMEVRDEMMTYSADNMVQHFTVYYTDSFICVCNIFTHAYDIRGSKARVCLRLSVHKTKMTETTITKLATGTVHHESSPTN